MAAGFTITAADVNNQAGRLIVATWQALDDVRRFKAWLDDSVHNDAFLNALGITGATGTAGSDVALIRTSFTDLDKLRQISHAAATQASANDFFFSAKNLSGLQNVTV